MRTQKEKKKKKVVCKPKRESSSEGRFPDTSPVQPSLQNYDENKLLLSSLPFVLWATLTNLSGTERVIYAVSMVGISNNAIVLQTKISKPQSPTSLTWNQAALFVQVKPGSHIKPDSSALYCDHAVERSLSHAILAETLSLTHSSCSLHFCNGLRVECLRKWGKPLSEQVKVRTNGKSLTRLHG